MFLSIPFFADLSTLTRHRQRAIDLRLLQANAHRTRHEYKVNNHIYLSSLHCKSNEKLQLQYDGPFPILQVHMSLSNVHERVFIRHLKPCLASP